MKLLSKLAMMAALGLAFSCGQVRYIPVETIREVHVRDSVAVHDTLVKYQLEKEYIREYSKDTLRMETRYSEFEAYQDTLTGLLAGEARNKAEHIGVKVQWKERIVYRDSVIVKEVPVEVRVPEPYVPAVYKWGLRAAVLMLIGIGCLAVLRFRRII